MKVKRSAHAQRALEKAIADTFRRDLRRAMTELEHVTLTGAGKPDTMRDVTDMVTLMCGHYTKAMSIAVASDRKYLTENLTTVSTALIVMRAYFSIRDNWPNDASGLSFARELFARAHQLIDQCPLDQFTVGGVKL